MRKLHQPSRRQALELIAGAGALLAIGGCGSDESDSSSPSTAGSNADPTSEASSTTSSTSSAAMQVEVKDVHIRLSAGPATAQIIAGVDTDVYSFDAQVIEGDPGSVVPSSSYLGPTLHFRQGQRVRISFENRLSEESIVHWHGLTLPQDQDGQPGEAVGPQETYEYDFVVANEPGTYWYHPHPHQRTGEQVYRGLAGLIVIHGDSDSLPTGDNDVSLVIQDRTIDQNGELQYVTTQHDRMAGFIGNTLVTNGVTEFVASVRPEPYRIRILNGANSLTHYLAWAGGEQCHVVATDGELLAEAVTTPGVIITPAQRTDLWVDFSTFAPGEPVQLLSAGNLPAGIGMGMGMGLGGGLDASSTVVATFLIEDAEPKPGAAPSKLGPALSPLLDQAVNPDDPKQFVLSTRQAAHWINGTQWEGRNANDVEVVRAGTVELWEFVNQSPLAHPMHLHGRAFQVTARSWDDESLASSWAEIEHGVVETGLRDTVLVWPGQRIQIAVPFAEHEGYFLYHCHILEHEDAGMMRNFLVTS